MEIVILFLMTAAVVLGFLCLLIIEYQNVRSKHWRRIKTTHSMMFHPPTPAPKSTPIKHPEPREPAQVT